MGTYLHIGRGCPSRTMCVGETGHAGALHRAVLLCVLLALLVLALPAPVRASYPRIANIYFPDLSTTDLESLARWDVLIIPKRAGDTGLAEMATLRALNPEIILIAHMPVGYHGDWTEPPVNGDLVAALNANDWWLKDTAGERMTLPCGDGILNETLTCPENPGGDRLCDWLPEYIAARLGPGGPWDGVFLDCCYDDVSWVNNANDLPADADGDGEPDEPAALNASWRAGMEILTLRLRELVGDDFIVTTNGNNTFYDQCNGSTREGFPYMHGNWYENITNPVWGYEAICSKFDINPGFSTVNTMWDGEVQGGQLVRDDAFESMFAFTFASVLVYGDGYFSFDGGEGLPDHSQEWWHDWYDVDLGEALGRSEEVPKSVEWVGYARMVRARRFQRGVVVVNPTTVTQRVDLGRPYVPLSSYNGEFYPFRERVRKVNVERQSGALLVGSGQMLQMPAGIETVRSESGVVTLSWPSVSGAARYSIYKAHRPDGTLNPLYLESTVSTTSFCDTLDAWESAFYRVAPIDEIGCEGAPSEIVALRPTRAEGRVATDTDPDRDDPGWVDGAGTGDEMDETRERDEYPWGCSADVDGAVEPHGDASVRGGPTDASPVRLVGPSPNPAHCSTRIVFDLGPGAPPGVEPTVSVYDITGRLVYRSVTAGSGPGRLSVEWDLRDTRGTRVAAGCYLVAVEGIGAPARGKLVVMPAR